MGRPKKYLTEEERKEAIRKYRKQYYQNNKEKELSISKKYRQEHKEEIAEYSKQYRKEHKEEIAEYVKKWRGEHSEYVKKYYKNNKDKFVEYVKKYYINNKDKFVEYLKLYNKTKMGRASYLVNRYKRSDKETNRGECTLTPQWIVENIFPKPCIYCGEVGWKIMGCDRINNSKPHTPENVVPCCGKCNRKRHTKEFKEYMKLIGKIA